MLGNKRQEEIKVEMSNSQSVDAFGRLRVSSPHTIFEAQNQYNASSLFYESTLTGSGTLTHLPNESAVSLNVTTASGDKVVRQSREYFRYIPGKGLLIKFSAILGSHKSNVRQRLGYFDSNDGLFFECDGSTFGVVRRTSTSGSPVDNRVAQSSFNLDKLDGTGKSKFTLDLSKANIFLIDLQWLGSGRVRLGTYDEYGNIIYCHEFRNANSLSIPYIKTANLPLRTELENTGTTASSSSIKSICNTVIIENSSEQSLGINHSASNGITTIAVTTRRSVISIRPKATFNSIINRGKICDVVSEIFSDANAYYEIVYNGTLGGTPSWTSVNADSIVEYDVAGTTVTGGIIIARGYVTIGAKAGSNIAVKSILSKLPITLDIAGANPINISIVVTSFSGTSNISAMLGWLEIY